MANMDQTTTKNLHAMANGFAKERIEQELQKIISEWTTAEGLPSNDIESMKQNIGRILATSYSKGYADCYEQKGLKRLIF